MNRVFYGVDGRSIDHLLGNGFVDNILISAIMLWRNGKFALPNRLPKHDALFLDSGGFTFTNRTGTYPFTPEQYAGIALEIVADYVAVMDYPCKPGEDNATKIDQTIQNSIACHAIKGVPWVQVVQGGDLTEYQTCCDLIKKWGLETPIMAVGSLKCRSKSSEVLAIIRAVSRNFPSVKIHAFGPNLRAIRNRYIRNILYQSDTTVWRINSEGGNRFPKSMEEKLRNYDRYRVKMDKILKEDQLSTYLCGEDMISKRGVEQVPALEPT